MFAGFDTVILQTRNMHETKQNLGQPQIDFLLRCASSLQLITIDVQGIKNSQIGLTFQIQFVNF